jgi:adenylate cyclase
VRITGQLIDAATDAHLWASRFDGSLADIFELQDRVAVSVAGVIEPALQAAEIRRSAARPTTDLSAYDLYLRALAAFHQFTRERVFEALGLLEQAIAIDRHYGLALSWAAICHLRLVRDGWAEEPETSRRKAMDLARQALQVSENDPGILANAALVLAQFGEDIGAVIGLVDRALTLNPSFARGWYLSGIVRIFAGQSDFAIEHLETSLRLSPRERMGAPLVAMGEAYFFKRRFDEAAAKLLLAIQDDPGFPCHTAPRGVLCPFGAARRSACDRRPAARHQPSGHPRRFALSQPRGPRAAPVGPAPVGRRGGMSQNPAFSPRPRRRRSGYSRLRLCTACPLAAKSR